MTTGTRGAPTDAGDAPTGAGGAAAAPAGDGPNPPAGAAGSAADPEPLTVWEGEEVAALRRAWEVPALEIRARTGSTNDGARALAEAGAAAGTVVLADAQSAGRGRRGRTWTDAPGRSVLLSMVWRPAGPAPGAAPLRAGLAVAEALAELGVADVSVKWPNDVLARGRKLAGVLCEGAVGGAAPYLVVGVGINVLQGADELPRELAATATSVALAAGAGVSRRAVATAVVRGLLAAAPRATDPLSAAELAALGARDALAGRPVAVDDVPAGVAEGVAADGALRVRRGAGPAILVRHGTVRPLEATNGEAAR